jgi:hypothetical protein
MAQLTRPLGSITFAACSMAYLEIAEKIAPFAKCMLAPQVDVIETLRFGFDYDFLRLIPFSPPSERTVPLTIANVLMQRFQSHPPMLDNKMEEPLSLIQLKEITSLKNRFWSAIQQIHRNNSQFFRQNWPEIVKQAHVSEVVSNRFTRSMITKGKSQQEAFEFAKRTQKPARNPDELDLVNFLKWINQNYLIPTPDQSLSEAEVKLKTELISLESEFKTPSTVEVFNASDYANHFGMSFDASPIREGRI